MVSSLLYVENQHLGVDMVLYVRRILYHFSGTTLPTLAFAACTIQSLLSMSRNNVS